MDYVRRIAKKVGPLKSIAPISDSDIVGVAERMPLRKPAMRGVSLPIPLVSQENNRFCAVATAKMILEYFGISGLTQERIADAIGTNSVGTDPGMEGLDDLLGAQWSTDLQRNPTFDQTSTYLNNFLPGKSGIREHARLLRGWREYIYINPDNGRPSFKMQFYLINDPYPTGAGQYILESVSKPITNHRLKNTA